MNHQTDDTRWRVLTVRSCLLMEHNEYQVSFEFVYSVIIWILKRICQTFGGYCIAPSAENCMEHFVNCVCQRNIIDQFACTSQQTMFVSECKCKHLCPVYCRQWSRLISIHKLMVVCGFSAMTGWGSFAT